MSEYEPPEDVSKVELWNRMRRLEKKVFPNRRDVLKAGGVAAAAGAIGFGSGSASAQTASGQVGTASKPVDVEAATVNADEASHKVSDRTVYADHPDFGEVQDAVSFADSNGYDRVYLTGGGGSGASGEYLVTAGTGGYGVDTAGTDVELAGDGNAVLKLADAQASDHKGIVRLGNGGSCHGFVIDGNKANQTDGGNSVYQVGIYAPTGSEQADMVIRDMEIRNVQQRGAFLSAVDNLRCYNLFIHDCAHRGFHVESRLSNTYSNNVTLDAIIAENNGGSSDTNEPQSGIVIGDQVRDFSATNLIAVNNNGHGFRTEKVARGKVSGIAYNNGKRGAMFATSSSLHADVLADNNTGDGIYTGGSATVSGTMRANGNGGNGVVFDSTRIARNFNVTARDNGDHGVLCRGFDIGGSMLITSKGNNNNASGSVGIRLEADANADPCANMGLFATTLGHANGGVGCDGNNGDIHIYGYLQNGIVGNSASVQYINS